MRNRRYPGCHVNSCDPSWLGSPNYKSPPFPIWWPYGLRKRKYYVFNLSCDLTWSCDWRVGNIMSGCPLLYVSTLKALCQFLLKTLNDLRWPVPCVSIQRPYKSHLFLLLLDENSVWIMNDHMPYVYLFFICLFLFFSSKHSVLA